MMAATIVEIPTSFIVSIAVYLAGIWATAMYLGAAGYEYNRFFVVTSSVLWPLFLLLVGVIRLGDWMSEGASGLHGDRTRVIICYIKKVFYYVFLPFRPFTIGRKIADMCDSRKRRKEEGDGK